MFIYCFVGDCLRLYTIYSITGKYIILIKIIGLTKGSVVDLLT